MGYSIPAAMGAKYVRKEKQVIAVCGDGSFQMSMMEFATMKQHGIKAKVIVLKNSYLGMVREYQHYTYADHYSVVDLSEARIWSILQKLMKCHLSGCITCRRQKRRWISSFPMMNVC